MTNNPDPTVGDTLVNAAKLDAFHVAMRAFPREALVGVEHLGSSDAFLVRYDGKVYRITVEEA